MKIISTVFLLFFANIVITTAQSEACEQLKQYYIKDITPVSASVIGHYDAAKKAMQSTLMAIDIRDAKNYVQAAQQFVEKAEAEEPRHINKKVIAYLKRAASTLTLQEVQHYTKKAQETANQLQAKL